jgi:hypothetical protein
MKTLLILILTVALAAGAYLSKPSESDFRELVKEKYSQTNKPKEKSGLMDKLQEVVKGSLQEYRTETFMKHVTFKDRILWVDVVKDDQVIYSGAFTKWFERGEVQWESKPPTK